MSTNPYDVVQYPSQPHSQTLPDRLYALGRLFGMQPPDFRKARVLELGCSNGGNLFPMAATLPDAEFLGIDYSEKEIETGLRYAAAMGLKNITLRHQSITDFPAGGGPFDYIICHGVYSWVDDQVRDAIFGLFEKHLAPQGIAYLSYNTLPGWNMVRSLREMMQYHTKGFATPTEKAQQARLLLDFLESANPDPNGAFASIIKAERELLATQPDTYLLHEHLETHNHPFYFHQVMAKAQEHGFQYLAESNLHTMFVTNLTAKAQEVLNTVNDILQQEQYRDFLINRRFRATLFCRKDVTLNRNLTPSSLDGLYLSCALKPGSDTSINLTQDQDVKFVDGAKVLTTHNARATAILLVLSRAQTPMNRQQVIDAAKALLPDLDDAAAHALFNEMALKLLMHSSLTLRGMVNAYATAVSEKPVAAPFARLQACNQDWAVNQNHTCVKMDLFARCLVQFLDGQHDVEALTDKMMGLVESGQINIQRGSETIKERSRIAQMVTDKLNVMARTALLVA